MKYFVFSDAHGDYDALTRAVREYGYDPDNENHRLISCGDNFGRAETGKGSRGVFAYLTSPAHKNRPICLMGNHELILQDILFRRSLSLVDISNGEHRTVSSFIGKEVDEVTVYDLDDLSRSDLMSWLLSRPYYFETEKYIFLHGFLPFDYEKLRFTTDGLSEVGEQAWRAACWAKTPLMIARFAQDYPHGLNKTIVFGHWDNFSLRESFGAGTGGGSGDSIWRNETLGLCGLDCCTAVGHRIEMLTVED